MNIILEEEYFIHKMKKYTSDKRYGYYLCSTNIHFGGNIALYKPHNFTREEEKYCKITKYCITQIGYCCGFNHQHNKNLVDIRFWSDLRFIGPGHFSIDQTYNKQECFMVLGQITNKEMINDIKTRYKKNIFNTQHFDKQEFLKQLAKC